MTKAVARDVAPSGNKNAGQITLDREDRKLTKAEAGFQERGGIPELRCGDCHYFTGSGCRIVEGSIDADDVCDQFEPAREKGSMSSQIATAVGRAGDLPRVEMFINRVSENPQTGERRWYSTASGTKKDRYEERMSVALFKDFIRRAESREPAPAPFISEAWNGGLPYLGVAHYLDLNGDGIVGPTERVWVDGSVFKARGTFDDGPLAQAAYESIKRDIENNIPQDERVRISIAFLDYGHDHEGRGSFERKALTDTCPMCTSGVGEKVYKAGHLVHLALTRSPAYVETSIELEERSSMKTRRDDAASIVGDDLADELEKRQLESLTARSENAGIDPRAIVVKRGEDEGDEAKGTGSAASEREGDRYKSTLLGGALTLDDAEAALAERSADDPFVDQWDVLSVVLCNIAGPEKADQIRGVLSDFQSQVDVMTAKAVININNVLEAETAAEQPAPAAASAAIERSEHQEVHVTHPLDEAVAGLVEAYDEAVATPLDSASRLAMIQPAINAVGEAITRSVSTQAAPAAEGGAGVDANALMSMIQEALAPIQADIASLKSTTTVERAAPRTPRIPAPRGYQPVGPGQVVRNAGGEMPPVAPTVKRSKLSSLVRRSVGLQN